MSDGHHDDRLDQLVDLVVQLASGDLSARLEPSASGDSVDAVITGLNMLAEEFQALHAGLEQRVSERTALLHRAHRELERLALTDSLTGLANRTAFNDRVSEAIRAAEQGARWQAVMLLDLDGFKGINDSLGHPAGDAVLVEVARRLAAACRRTDTVARLGGDEFAILIIDATPVEVMRVAERTLRALREPVDTHGQANSVGASIGVCCGGAGQSEESMLRDADTAMYVAKAHGKNNVRVFEPAMHAAAVARRRGAEELRRAISDHQLILRYQPVTELATGTVAAVEAVVHWQHPLRGVVLPAEFMPVAEETGLIVELGRSAMQGAITQLSQWITELGCARTPRLHLNVSPVQLRSPGLVSDLRDMLDRYAVDARHLTLEITESALMSGDDGALRTLPQLKSLGLALAIDGFGTEHAPIGYLRELPLDAVKIDTSLISDLDRDPAHHRLVRAIVQVIHAVSLTAVADGIESAAQAAYLRSLGCAYGQGNYFGSPVPAAQITEMVVSSRRDRASAVPEVAAWPTGGSLLSRRA